MRRFWFGASLVLVFVFAVASSYIIFVLAGDGPQVAAPQQEQGSVSAAGAQIAQVEADTELIVRESYACGYVAEREIIGGEFAGQTFDSLAAEGWAVARVGENRVELARQSPGICPIEQQCRLICRTERGVAVYAGTAEHTGAMLLEMPLNFAELPPDMNTALLGAGYQVSSPAELDELLESLDELVLREDPE